MNATVLIEIMIICQEKDIDRVIGNMCNDGWKKDSNMNTITRSGEIGFNMWKRIDPNLIKPISAEIAQNEPELICELINDVFSWVMKVDGKTIPFLDSNNADYFSDFYSKLGYTIIWDRDKWEREETK